MTTFEIIAIILLTIIVALLGFIAFCVWNHYRDVEFSNMMNRKKLDNIDTNTATSVGVEIDTKDKIGHIHTILHSGFVQTGRSNGGSYIDPKYKE